ncbi:Exosome component 5 [Gaertneriomyces sp. JEL0708]|nr:Exosome component 5 [Gaertneriomyces sp. JEL0708]
MTLKTRPDKRKTALEFRPVFCSYGLLSRSDGSVRFKYGDTSVLCSVYGPTEVRVRDEKLDRASVEVLFKPTTGHTTTRDRLYERVIRETLESTILAALHPRTSIKIILQVLTDDGGVLSVAINAATMALLDAGVPMRDLPLSATCMIDGIDGELLLDPTSSELQRARSTHVFTFAPNSNGAITDISTGSFDLDEYNTCYDACKLAIDEVHKICKQTAQNKIAREYGIELE